MPSSTGARGWAACWPPTLPMVVNLVLGFIIGAVVLAGVKAVSRLRGAESSMAKRSVTAPRGLRENASGIDRDRVR